LQHDGFQRLISSTVDGVDRGPLDGVVVERASVCLLQEHDDEDDDQDECPEPDADTHGCLLPCAVALRRQG